MGGADTPHIAAAMPQAAMPQAADDTPDGSAMAPAANVYNVAGRTPFSRTALAMCVCEGVVFVVLLLAGVLVSALAYPFEPPGAYASGLALGCAFATLKILSLDRSLARALDMGPRAKNYAALFASIRYIATFAAFVPAIALPSVFGLFGTIAGVLSMQLSAYLTHPALKALDRRAPPDTAQASAAQASAAPPDAASPDAAPPDAAPAAQPGGGKDHQE